MKNLLLSLLALPLLVSAEPTEIEATVVCDDAKTMIQYIEKEYNETPVFMGLSDDKKSYYTVFASEDGESFSIIQMDNNNACMLSSGGKWKIKLPSSMGKNNL